MKTARRLSLTVAMAIGLVGCSKSEVTKTTSSPEPAPQSPATASATTAAPAAAPSRATVGQAAPDFELPSLDGPKVKLSSHRGKVVVLEWFNPDCPFVRQAHGRAGQLKGLAAKYADEGVVWLAINSGGAGRQGHGADTNRAGKKRFGVGYPILFDEAGAVGRRYGATNTPHMFVIDKQGTLVYAGALDNTKGGDIEDVSPHVHYVADAIADLSASRPVRVAETKAYGCSVKYAKN